MYVFGGFWQFLSRVDASTAIILMVQGLGSGDRTCDGLKFGKVCEDLLNLECWIDLISDSLRIFGHV